MHIFAYPQSYNDPNWEHVFVSFEDARINDACLAWFAQWCEQKNLYNNEPKPFFECMPALHALSNRTTANLEGFLTAFDEEKEEDDELRSKPGYLCARGIFTSALTGMGWEGFAMRCWTDPQGYAGYMQFIEQQGMYELVDDLVDSPHAGGKLKEALSLYGENLGYPWIGAACIRWAIFGKNTNIEDVPHSVQWLKTLYAPRQDAGRAGTREVLGKPMNFSEFAPIVNILLQSPDVWMHMFLQEGYSMQKQQTYQLWLHLAESIGYECIKERELFEKRQYLEFCNSILQGDASDLEMMHLAGLRDYLSKRAVRNHSTKREIFELPAEMESPNI